MRARYEGQEYVFVYDATGTLLVNPAVQAMIGTHRLDVKDPNGVPYVREMLCRDKPRDRRLTLRSTIDVHE